MTGSATWNSATPATATIDPAGLATSVAAGASVISATLIGISGSTTLTVTAPALQSITVTPRNAPWLQPAATEQFKATGNFSDGTTTDLSATAAWTSSSSLVATVSATGLATAVAVGSAVISAASGGVSGSAPLTVTTATLSTIAVAPAAPAIAAGQTRQLTATGSYSDGTSQDLTSSVAWTSATPAAATVNAATGVATGVAPGSSVITATLGAVSANVTLTVNAAALTKLDVTPASPSVPSGSTQQFKATGTFSDGTTADLTASVNWSSASPGVATIGAGGLATVVAAGGSLTLFANNPGKWGNSLKVSVALNPGNASRFSLQVLNGSQVVESFVNLSTTSTDPQFVVTVIDNDSQYISFINPATNLPVVPAAAPSATATPIVFSGGADGTALVPASDQNFELAMLSNAAAGIHLLDRVEIFNLLCVPGETDAPTISTLQQYCSTQRAFYIVDSPETATTRDLTTSGPAGSTPGALRVNTRSIPLTTSPGSRRRIRCSGTGPRCFRPADSWRVSMPPPTPTAACGKRLPESTPRSPGCRACSTTSRIRRTET